MSGNKEKKNTMGMPYLAALASHSLIGDYVSPPVQLFWPLTTEWYGINSGLILMGTTQMIAEIILFILMIITIIYLDRKNKKSKIKIT